MLQSYFCLHQFQLIKWSFFIHSTTPYIHPRLVSLTEPKFSDRSDARLSLYLYLGGNEINPALYQINFNETLMLSDQPWEFHPFGRIRTEFCKKDSSVIHWDEGKGTRLFTSKQMIVQSDYILQFKVKPKKICVFQVTLKFKIGTVGRKIFLFC